jgi:hypothetical protein
MLKYESRREFANVELGIYNLKIKFPPYVWRVAKQSQKCCSVFSISA